MRIGTMVLPAAALLIGTGCASSWGITNLGGQANCKTKYFYLDADGDGWGDPGAEREEHCTPDEENKVTARNQLDCDDSDPGVSARIDALCPHELVSDISYQPGGGDASDSYVSATAGETELVATIGSTSRSYPLAAESACFFWGGSLAKLSAGDDRGNVLAAIEAGLDGEEHYAAYVAIMWDEDDWRWMEPEDMDPDGTIGGAPSENFPELNGNGESITWCGDEAPTEFDDDGKPYADQWLKRVAIVGKPGAGGYTWCYGSPERADEYTWSSAHFICERAAPNKACYENRDDYCEYRTPEEVAALEGN